MFIVNAVQDSEKLREERNVTGIECWKHSAPTELLSNATSFAIDISLLMNLAGSLRAGRPHSQEITIARN